ncbi:hypothetical protein IAT40_007485 [Kwoniella sp. CBS 6097]
MVIRIDLSLTAEGEAGPSTFAEPSSDPAKDLRDVVSVIRNAKNLVIISGAGVSTAANIPDFRSAKGIFNDGFDGLDDDGEATDVMVRGNGKGKGKGRARSGPDIKDLFHVKCLTQHSTLAAHNALISSLALRALDANPTPFHICLSSLSSSGRLLRCYTQNIDDLESKVGFNVGIPPGKSKSKSNSLRKRNGSSASKGRGLDRDRSEASYEPRSRSTTMTTTMTGVEEYGFQSDLLDPQLLHPTSTALSPSASAIEPNVIPLHGLLSTLHCTLCHTLVPLAPHLPLPPTPLPCPTCQLDRTIRSALSERPRKSGHLRPSVVLYGEEHPQGELIGQIVERDLKRVDALLVVGTSLSVPGVKRIVKEMSKVIHSKSTKKTTKGTAGGRRGVVYVNAEPPAKPAEWKNTFDYFVQGDIQDFIVEHLENAETTGGIVSTQGQTDSTSTEPSTPRKKRAGKSKKEISDIVFPPTPESLARPGPVRGTASKKRKNEPDLEIGSETAITDASNALFTPTKSRKTAKRVKEHDVGNGGVPPTPQSMERARARSAKFRGDHAHASEDEDQDEEDDEDAIRDRQGTPTPLPFDL